MSFETIYLVHATNEVAFRQQMARLKRIREIEAEFMGPLIVRTHELLRQQIFHPLSELTVA